MDEKENSPIISIREIERPMKIRNAVRTVIFLLRLAAYSCASDYAARVLEASFGMNRERAVLICFLCFFAIFLFWCWFVCKYGDELEETRT